MPAPDEVSLYVGRLEAMGVAYMVTGATAAILYGQPRVTNDLNVVLTLDDAGRAALLRAIREITGVDEAQMAPWLERMGLGGLWQELKSG